MAGSRGCVGGVPAARVTTAAVTAVAAVQLRDAHGNTEVERAGLALRLVQRLEQMAAGMEPILPQPPKDGEHTLAFEPSAAPAALEKIRMAAVAVRTFLSCMVPRSFGACIIGNGRGRCRDRRRSRWRMSR